MSDDNNSMQTEEQPQAKRGRPRKERQRRNYAKELAALQGRVDTAARLLRRCHVDMNVTMFNELVQVAIATLTGE